MENGGNIIKKVQYNIFSYSIIVLKIRQISIPNLAPVVGQTSSQVFTEIIYSMKNLSLANI